MAEQSGGGGAPLFGRYFSHGGGCQQSEPKRGWLNGGYGLKRDRGANQARGGSQLDVTCRLHRQRGVVAPLRNTGG